MISTRPHCTGPETKGPLDLSALSVKVDCPNSEILGPGSIPNMAEEGAEKKTFDWLPEGMEPLADGEYDAIIMGTGLKECVISGLLSVQGMRVLQM
ncbi:hypothetical protein THAOC_33689, partial [Thalassiosira oceanica]